MKLATTLAGIALFGLGFMAAWLSGPRVTENPDLFPTRIYLIVDDQVDTRLVSKVGLVDDIQFDWSTRSYRKLTDEERMDPPGWLAADPSMLFTTKAAADSALCDLLNRRLEAINKQIEGCTK